MRALMLQTGAIAALAQGMTGARGMTGVLLKMMIQCALPEAANLLECMMKVIGSVVWLLGLFYLYLRLMFCTLVAVYV